MQRYRRDGKIGHSTAIWYGDANIDNINTNTKTITLRIGTRDDEL